MQFPQAGQIFQDKYKLVNVLGRGGFAAVYRAMDIEVGREVAIKMLLPSEEGYDSAAVARFSREARVVAQLRDPHTITMFDFGRSDAGLLYMVFEYVAGKDLAHLLSERGSLPVDTTLHVLSQVLQALREAHAAGVLHRDIKPANVLVYSYMDDDFRVKLLDFGIAKPGIGKDGDPVATLTRAGGIVGTPRYMSPEQLCGDDLGPTTDIYSLGLVAYEMLIGAPAISGRDTKDTLRLQLSEQPLLFPPTSDVPPFVRAVVERMMARDAGARFQSVVEVHEALRRGATHEPVIYRTPVVPEVAPRISTRPITAIEAPRTTSRAERVAPRSAFGKLPPVAMLGIGIVVGVLVAALLVLVSREPPPEPAPVPAKLVENPLGRGAVEEPVPEKPPVETKVVAAPVVEEPLDPCSPSATVTRGARVETETFGLEPRSWLTYVPTSYVPGKRHALVLLVHDRTRAPRRELMDMKFDERADEHGFVVIAPQGTDYSNPWDVSKDVEFFAALVARTRESLCIDPRRLYGVGHNFGAGALEHAACDIPFSAIATTAWRGDGQAVCANDPRVPHIHLVGDENRYAPIKGGATCEGLGSVALTRKEAVWRTHNKCRGETRTYLDDPEGTCKTWTCEAPFVSCVVKGGRDWPDSASRDFQLPACNREPGKFPISETVWDFFAKHGRDLEDAP